MLITEKIKNPQLAEGTFDPSDANHLVSFLIDGYSRFYHHQFLTQYERDHSIGLDWIEGKKAMLSQQKKELQSIIAEAELTGKDVSIDGLLNVKVAH